MRVGMCGALGVTAPSLATCGPVKACVEPCMCQPVPMGVPGPTVRHHCEALRAERSPDPWTLHSCWSSVDSAVLFGAQHAQTSQLSDLPRVSLALHHTSAHVS